MKDGVSGEKVNIAVFVSGGGTNLQALLDAEKNGVIRSGRIVLVVSDNPSAYALQRAKNAGKDTAIAEKKRPFAGGIRGRPDGGFKKI